MAKAPPKKPVKSKVVKQHLLEPVLRDLVEQVTLIADTVKTKPVEETQFFPANDVVGQTGPIGEDPPLVPPPPPVSPPPPPIAPPPEPIICCDEEFCNFLKNAARPLVKSYPTWDPSKPAGQKWEWTAE